MISRHSRAVIRSPGRALRLLTAIVALPAGAEVYAQLDAARDGSVLPRPPLPFVGTLEPTEAQSTPFVAPPVRAPEGAPNILLVMTDDVGFASASTFGGSVPTPNLDRLAASGLRYNQFHTTGICSPTRAALLTGRNHHAVGVGMLADIASPYPGYTAHIAPDAATVARVLRDNGFNTAMFGKEHNVPTGERSQAGPFDQWPTGRGFEYFYGFVGGDTNQWNPALYEGISRLEVADRPDDYLLDRDLADRVINWIHNQQAGDPSKPFFVYLAPGTAHAPHQAPKDWIARFHGRFDHGWDKERELILKRQKALGVVPPSTRLSPRPAEVPAWDSLLEVQQRVYARFMEVYAAALSYQDAQFGRIMDELARMGIADNTLVVFVQGDNGSSGEGGREGTLNEMAHLSSQQGYEEPPVAWLAEHLDILGGPDTYQGYPIGWTYATNTPFPWFKTHASHLGGVRNGLVVSWPQRIKRQGEVRHQYHHVIDIMPTLLEAAGVKAPTMVDGIAQRPMDGASMLYSFDQPQADSTRQTQYYEMLGNRAIYHEGWLANTTPRNMPWNVARDREGSDTSTYAWELYDLRSDFSQSNNVADQFPERLQALQALFDREARNNQVYPLHDTGGTARFMKMAMLGKTGFRPEYVYWGPGISLQFGSAPAIVKLPFSLEADITVPDGGANGVMVAAGGKFGGWSFYLQDGVPVAYASTSPLHLPELQSRIKASEPLSPGHHTVRYDYRMTGQGGVMTIAVDDGEVATGAVARHPEMFAGNGETFDTGRDTNDPVSPDYQGDGAFNGQLNKVVVKLKMPVMGKGPGVAAP